MNKNKSRNAANLLDTATRRQFVIELKKSGANYRQIAKAAVEKFGAENLPQGWDCRYAYKDVKRELEKLYVELRQSTEIVRQLELERLDLALLAIMPQVRTGHLGAIDRLIRISKRRSELEGLDAAIQHDVTTKGKELTVKEITIRLPTNERPVDD